MIWTVDTGQLLVAPPSGCNLQHVLAPLLRAGAVSALTWSDTIKLKQ